MALDVSTVLTWALDGAHVRNIGTRDELDRPWGVCLSPSGDLLYVASRENHNVQVYGAEV